MLDRMVKEIDMSILVDGSDRSDGYPFAAGPLQRSEAPLRRTRVGPWILLAILMVGAVIWIYLR